MYTLGVARKAFPGSVHADAPSLPRNCLLPKLVVVLHFETVQQYIVPGYYSISLVGQNLFESLAYPRLLQYKA